MTDTASAHAAADQVRGSAIDLTLTVNGTHHALSIDPRVTLLDALREHTSV